jgi:copper resistance protein D
VGGAAPGVTAARLRWWAGGGAVVAATVAVAWALAHPELPVAVTTARALSDGAAVTALGLAVVPLLDAHRHRAELIRRARRPLILVGAAWIVAESIRLTVTAAQAAGSPVVALSLRTMSQFATTTTPGRSALFGIAAAAVVTGIAVTGISGTMLLRAAITAASAGVAARAITGHLSDSLLGGVAVAGHALAAGLWCGTLAALAITVDTRGRWARVLPAFSGLALWCTTVLLAGGVTAALVTVGSPADLYTTGYGRILLAKVAVTAVLLMVAWRNRTGWLTAARNHRISARGSLVRSAIELSLMAVALTLAAALSVTG